jgi:hypothetical protein
VCCRYGCLLKLLEQPLGNNHFNVFIGPILLEGTESISLLKGCMLEQLFLCYVCIECLLAAVLGCKREMFTTGAYKLSSSLLI